MLSSHRNIREGPLPGGPCFAPSPVAGPTRPKLSREPGARGSGEQMLTQTQGAGKEFHILLSQGLLLLKGDLRQRKLGHIAARDMIFGREKGISDKNADFLELKSPGLEELSCPL